MAAIKINLTREEQDEAIYAGKHIRERRIQSGSVHKWNRQNDYALNDPITSVAAEIAAGRAIGRKWVYRTSPDKAGDLGLKEQVRHTKYPYGKLTLHPEDIDDHKFILVTGIFPFFDVRGWLFAVEGKEERFWSELQKGRPAFNVGQRYLRPMESWHKIKELPWLFSANQFQAPVPTSIPR